MAAKKQTLKIQRRAGKFNVYTDLLDAKEVVRFRTILGWLDVHIAPNGKGIEVQTQSPLQIKPGVSNHIVIENRPDWSKS